MPATKCGPERTLQCMGVCCTWLFGDGGLIRRIDFCCLCMRRGRIIQAWSHFCGTVFVSPSACPCDSLSRFPSLAWTTARLQRETLATFTPRIAAGTGHLYAPLRSSIPTLSILARCWRPHARCVDRRGCFVNRSSATSRIELALLLPPLSLSHSLAVAR
ncbi:hypothetical protein BU26DRAFT_11427 [Trematosphaeria pertusa]|uniref:Uncharacterized protein n=1 Tax=Trematosphaeria pertusa TaxID=390896 RepID=A0A6A6J152_9PLEO|nr:uncharacterized protein BU26DRAFT_11427 [Trematosphaeria pertusa]KAF2255902.1 hypothetical protein BU26DRAFT_11427 [Trematosphaeria pertusa]